MSDGVKRNISYLNHYQLRIVVYYLIFGIAYGAFMAMMLVDENGSGLGNAAMFFRVFLIIALTTTQTSIIKGQVPLALSFSSRRSDLIKGHLVMTVLLVAEVAALLTVSDMLIIPGLGIEGYALSFIKYAGLLLFTSSLGLMMGLLPSGMGAVVMRILIIITFIVVFAVISALGEAVGQSGFFRDLIGAFLGGADNAVVLAIAITGVVVGATVTVLSHVIVARKIQKMEVHF